MEEEQYHYRMKPLKDSSEKYGNCEICGRWVDSVYYQVESRDYFSPVQKKISTTYHNCSACFGHEECLLSIRR